jgi:hypothetical protein
MLSALGLAAPHRCVDVYAAFSSAPKPSVWSSVRKMTSGATEEVPSGEGLLVSV